MYPFHFPEQLLVEFWYLAFDFRFRILWHITQSMQMPNSNRCKSMHPGRIVITLCDLTRDWILDLGDARGEWLSVVVDQW